jgi:N-acetylmuramoyl-L-alanine amidase
MIFHEVSIMNLDVRTLILAASVMASAPMNLASANPAHESPLPVALDEDVKNRQKPDRDAETSDGDDDTPKANRSQPVTAKVPNAQPGKNSGNLNAELHCLALNIYHEAGAESHTGKQAVAAVTLNRVKSDAFPKSVCGVVKQRDKNSCQFSWWCQKPKSPPKDSDAWQDSVEIARKTLEGLHKDPTQGALYFHATRVKPDWSRTYKRTTRIGNHIFYKPTKSAA